MIDPKRIAVLVPVYNESAHLDAFLARLKKTTDLTVLVVDDGSTDGSGEAARRHGVEVLRLSPNRGKGAALRAGFERLLSRGAEWVVIMDADGQHLPEEIARFVSAAEEGRFGVLNGNRLHRPQGMPLLRLAVNRLMSGIISVVARQKIHDTQCGFKMISGDVLRAVSLGSDRFEIEDEILLEAAARGFHIGSVPVTSRYAGETSHIHPVRDTMRFVRFLLKRAFK